MAAVPWRAGAEHTFTLSKIQKLLLNLFWLFAIIATLPYVDDGIHWSLQGTALYFCPSGLQQQQFSNSSIKTACHCFYGKHTHTYVYTHTFFKKNFYTYMYVYLMPV